MMSEPQNNINDENTVNEIRGKYHLLIQRGKYILHCIGKGILKVEVHSWIVAAADHILPIMPLEIPEYQEIKDIRDAYQKSNILVPGSLLADVSKIFENLLTAHRCFNLGVMGVPQNIPPQNLANIAYEFIKQSTEYMGNNLIKKLIDKEDGTTRRTALLHTYGKIYCLAESIVRLNKIVDHLAIAGCTRAILELFVDMHLLYNSNEKKDVKRYFSFPDINRFNTAKNIASLRKEHNLVDPDEPKPIDKFLADITPKEEEMKSLRKKLWGTTKKQTPIQPHHWTELSMVDRVKKTNDRTLMNTYLETYYYCNWSVHSGYSDFPGRNAEDVHLFNCHLYSLSNDMFIDSSILINNEIQAVENETLQSELDNIRQVSSRRFWGELVRAGMKNH